MRPWGERQRSLEKPDRSRVVALGGPSSGGAEVGGCAPRELHGGTLGRAELSPEQDGALEMVAEQLVGDRDGG